MKDSRVRRRLTPFVRLGLSLAAVAVALLLLPLELRPVARLLVAFNVGGITLLLLIAAAISGTSADDLRQRVRAEHAGAGRVLIAALVACVSGLGAVLVVLHSAHGRRVEYRLELLLSTVTVFCAWLILQSVCATFYARYYYGTDAKTANDRRGIQFSGGEAPDSWDFAYFAFTIGVCYATSDTPITSRTIRRAALAHMLVSFLFYTFLVGMLINAIGALISP